MSKFKILSSESSEIAKGPHRDYPINLENANNFIAKTKKSLLRGMNVKVSDGEHIEKAILVISYSPLKEAKMGNSATPINLHQSSIEVNKQIESIFNSYMRCVREIESSNI